MASRKKDRFSGPGDISEQLWHYDGNNSYKEFGTRESTVRGIFNRGHFSSEEKIKNKLTQFMSAGGMRYEARISKEEYTRYTQRVRVIKMLVVFVLVWIVFRFVSV